MVVRRRGLEQGGDGQAGKGGGEGGGEWGAAVLRAAADGAGVQEERRAARRVRAVGRVAAERLKAKDLPSEVYTLLCLGVAHSVVCFHFLRNVESTVDPQ
ncbi:uncharacterized protein A4U43_C01F16080 [Asparagus officinalis]|uniref:Uncharacterized protein n=1 Tax=Asparagus officinalis TaxID=4686 RepID=A0A5P1FTG2_ASPOF|nr:uncharacterized protein A4U43_C01F16080 [Asparagus officinalis]